MQKIPALSSMIGVSLALAFGPASAQTTPELIAQLKVMRQQLDEQRARVDALERQLQASSAPAAPVVSPTTAQTETLGPATYPDRLQALRGAGAAPADAGQANVGANQPGAGDAVGRPPAPRAPEVAPIFESPGVLTPTHKLVVEPSVQYGYSSNNRVALVGYTVIPALLIGLLDVREVKQNTTTAAVDFRYGFNNRIEFDFKVPYVYRSDSTISRELFTGTSSDAVFANNGKGIGDLELGARYQLNSGGIDQPYYIAGVRFKSRTGRDPFEVVTDCQTRCIGENVTGTGLPVNEPTGSGFYSLQPSLTFLLPSDPAIFFGGVSYTKNFKRSDISRTVLNGEKEYLGSIDPGDVFGFNLGMGLALNEKASFSIGYDHSSVGRMYQNNVVIPGSVRVQLGTLLLGASYKMDNQRTLSVSLGAGMTRDTPDMTLMVRMPFTF
jgi:hypothetical protein